MMRRVIVAATGASGIIYFYRFLNMIQPEFLSGVILSKWAKFNLERELGIEFSKLRESFEGLDFFDNDDLSSPIASGSYYFDSYVIIPTTITTLGKLSSGIGDNLITRVGLVALKERRRLIISLRETPLSSIDLENAYRLSLAGAIISPISPPFYHNPNTIEELVDFYVKRIIQLAVS